MMGIKYLGGPGDADKRVNLKPGGFMTQDPEVGYAQTSPCMCCATLLSVLVREEMALLC
jgi:hypothetical protein